MWLQIYVNFSNVKNDENCSQGKVNGNKNEHVNGVHNGYSSSEKNKSSHKSSSKDKHRDKDRSHKSSSKLSRLVFPEGSMWTCLLPPSSIKFVILSV